MHETGLEQGGYNTGRVGGIDIGVHWSLLVVVFMISFELAAGYFPVHVRGAGTSTYWELGW